MAIGARRAARPVDGFREGGKSAIQHRAPVAKLIEIASGSAAQKLWDLLKRLLPGQQEQGIEDRQQRITFVWDEPARRDGLVATAAMIRVCQAITAIPDGTVLNWDPEAGQWRYASPA